MKHSFFSLFTKEIAIDLGTANTLIIYNDKIVVDEPSIVALERQTGKILAFGKKAMMMHGRVHENIIVVRPLRGGVIADFKCAEHLIRSLIKMAVPKKMFITPALRMVIGIPSGITAVEERAVRNSAEQVGAKEVYLIHEPMAAAIGSGIDVFEPVGNMIVDIGGGTTEIAVISLGGIVCNKSILTAGDEFNSVIVDYIRRTHSIVIGIRTAERLKIEVGSATPELEVPPPDYAVRGKDIISGIPKEIMVNYAEIAFALDKSIAKIEAAVLNALEMTPPELSADIYRTGIYMAGGGSLLRGLHKRIAHKTGLKVHVADDPLRAVVRGTGIALKNFDKFPFLIK